MLDITEIICNFKSSKDQIFCLNINIYWFLFNKFSSISTLNSIVTPFATNFSNYCIIIFPFYLHCYNNNILVYIFSSKYLIYFYGYDLNPLSIIYLMKNYIIWWGNVVYTLKLPNSFINVDWATIVDLCLPEGKTNLNWLVKARLSILK